MKKQVVSFLALFGLVFVLSIYYVLLPTNLFVNSNGVSDDIVKQVGYTIEESSNLYFTKLNSKLVEKRESEVFNLESIVASPDVENEKKASALNELVSVNKIIASEEKIVSMIKEKGYYNAYCEYQDDMIKIIVQADSLTNEQAAELISLVMDNSINGLLPEIEYKN